MQSDIHKLGLGILEKILNEVEKDTGVNNLFSTVKPICEEMVKSYFPNQFIEVNPFLTASYKLVTGGNKIEEKEINLKDQVK